MRPVNSSASTWPVTSVNTTRLESFSLLNFTTSWNNAFGTNFGANVWIRNLADEEYNVSASNQMLSVRLRDVLVWMPREYGIQLQNSF